MSKERMGFRMKQMLTIMFDVYACWRSDLMLYALSITNGDHSAAGDLYRKLRNRGYLDEYEPVYPKSKSMYGKKNLTQDEIQNELKSNEINLFQINQNSRSGYVLVMINSKLINYLADHEPNPYFYKNRNGVRGKRFRTTNYTRIIRELMISRSMLFMAAADTAVAMHEKPSMYRLFGYMNNGAEGRYSDETDHKRFKDYLALDREGCIDLLNTTGVFYTNAEVIQCVNLVWPNRADTFRGSRFYGVYLSNKTAFILYQEYPGADKQIGVKQTFETRLSENINAMFKEELSYSRKVPYKNLTTELYTAIISDGDSLMYTMAMQTKHGRINFTDEELEDQKKMEARLVRIQEFVKYKDVLGANQSIYPRVFITPATNSGVLSMNYLCHHSVTEYFRDSADLVKSRPDLFKPSATMHDPFVFGWEKENAGISNRSVIFLPVFEINLVREISISAEGEQFADKYALITLPQMADALSHAMRRTTTAFYDVSTLNRIYIDNDTGAPIALSDEDVRVIRDLIAANKILGNGEYWTWEELKQIRNEPSLKFNLSSVISSSPVNSSNKKTMLREITQYDIRGIALNNQDKYAKLRKQTHIEKKRYRRPNQNKLVISLDTVEKKDMKTAANILGISMSELVLLFTMPMVREVIVDGKQRKSEQIQAMKAALSGKSRQSA